MTTPIGNVTAMPHIKRMATDSQQKQNGSTLVEQAQQLPLTQATVLMLAQKLTTVEAILNQVVRQDLMKVGQYQLPVIQQIVLDYMICMATFMSGAMIGMTVIAEI
jgi:hypothetical protein